MLTRLTQIYTPPMTGYYNLELKCFTKTPKISPTYANNLKRENKIRPSETFLNLISVRSKNNSDDVQSLKRPTKERSLNPS